MPRSLRLATASTLAVLGLSAPAAAVDEGVPDGNRHAAVGALAYDEDGAGPGGWSYLCTGSVVSDAAFVTAAHCVTAFEGVQWGVTLAPGSPAAPAVQPGVLPDDFPFAVLAPVMSATGVAVHPRFDPDRRRHDVAVVHFPPGTFADRERVRLPNRRLLERRARGARLRVRLVGYGIDPEWGDVGATSFVLEGYRQTATAPVEALRGGRLLLDGDPARTRQGGLCLGDSGSPQLLGTLAVSLFSSHDEDCTGTLVAQRLDTRPERRFLAREMRAAPVRGRS